MAAGINFINRLRLYKKSNLNILLRGMRQLIRAKVLGKPCLKYLDVALDYRCNMQCVHCFATAFTEDNRPKMNIDDYRRMAKEARSVGCLHFNIQGGEPLLIANIEEYISAFEPRQAHISITTNGYLLSAKKAERLKVMGVKQVVFSLDSFDAEDHDSFRGVESAHARVLDGINLAKTIGLGVSVNVTVSHQSLRNEKQKKLFAWLHKEKIPYNPIFASPVGAWKGRFDLMVNSDDKSYIESLQEKSGLAQRDIHASWVKQGCGAVAEQVYLTPYGDVLPCPFIHISLGNVNEEGLDRIWRRTVKQGLHGRYSPQCWVAENLRFAEALNELYASQSSLPIPHSTHEGIMFLKKYWRC